MEEVASGKSDKDGRSVKMLRLISDCNKHMGGVDKNDAMVRNYSCVRKSYKWMTKVFFHFIEEVVFNSFILYKKRGKKRLLQFKLNLIQSILREAHIDVDIAEAGHYKYVVRHYPELIPPTENRDKAQKRCALRTKGGRRKDSRYRCKVCANHHIMKNKIEGVTEH